jgi:hypothetical protein
MWALSGTLAAFVATLAYAGRGKLLHRGESTPGNEGNLAIVSMEPKRAPSYESAEGRPADERRAPEVQRMALPAPLIATDPMARSGSAAPATGTSTRAAAAPRRQARAKGKASWPKPSAAARDAGGRADLAPPQENAARSAAPSDAAGAREPSWSDVNEALAARDRARANRLLMRLSEQGPDADTRAKALLGIAQLEAGAGHCEEGRRLALEVASRPGIEIKTIRRALELASRCAR